MGLHQAELVCADTPFWSFLTVDAMGRTSDGGTWATGNVANPSAKVPLSIGGGSFAGAAVNAALAMWDFDAAVVAASPDVA